MSPGEVLGIGIGTVALAMATPPLFQMFWGRPNITFQFTRLENSVDTLLLAHIYNYPVTNRFLSGMGVRRDEAHFHVAMTVSGSDGNQILKYTEPPFTSGNPFRPIQFQLRPGPAPITLEILGANGKTARLYTEERRDSYHEFKSGNYVLRLDAWVGEKVFFESRTFVVTEDSRKSYWAEN